MPRGLYKLTQVAQTLEARRDWARLEQWCRDHGQTGLAEKHKPAADCGWRRIDKAIAATRAALGCASPTGWNGNVLHELEVK